MTLVPRKNRKNAVSPEVPEVPKGVVTELQDVPAAFRSASPKKPGNARKSSILSLAVVALVVPGLFATVALPAYALQTPKDTRASDAAQAVQTLVKDNAQSVSVAPSAAAAAVSRDGYTATSAAEIQRAAIAASYSAYTGPTVSDYLANPAYPSFDLASVAAVASQYQGVPYRYGGADPSGFDCSGFVMFVYAQFGIGLPHSSSGIGASGVAISRDAAVPGDVVIMPGHTGIYMGNGNFIDAGDYGEVITIRPIYDDDYFIVRLGI